MQDKVINLFLADLHIMLSLFGGRSFVVLYCRMSKVLLSVPEEFNFELCFQFLQRSPKELLHRVTQDRVIKLLRIENELILFSVKEGNRTLIFEFLQGPSSLLISESVHKYVREWFDLETDLKSFYELARTDELLKPLVKKFSGYRIIGQPDLFESLIWAVLGPPINLQLAYSL